MKTSRMVAGLVALTLAGRALANEETLPPLPAGRVPQTIEEIWGDYDPRREPLESEILKEWDADGLVCRIVRFRVGVFKGQKSAVAGIYAFPRAGQALPGLVQVHGGGQSANLNAAITHARRGYACLSLNWGGNPLRDGDYRQIWETAGTDWGAVDATHPPQRDPVNHFAVCTPNEFTIDPVESPRNSAWLLAAIAVRRALTFLEQQPEVEGSRLGVYGHSMGGKLTVVTAAVDARVKAAVPSCGGISDYPSERGWENSAYCRRLQCPVLFLNPVNDFYGRVDDLNSVVAALPADSWRLACAANLDHRDLPEHFACGPLWFDWRLREGMSLPLAPQATLELAAPDGVPRVTVTPDETRPVEAVDVYYTQQARSAECVNPCWRHVAARRGDLAWTAAVPLLDLDRPVRAYANVRYALESPVQGAGYYYGLYSSDRFTLSSRMLSAAVDELRAASVTATDRPSLVIEEFASGWERGWYVQSEDGRWPYRTNRVQDPKWKGPSGARLVLDVQSGHPNTLIVALDQHAAARELRGGEGWQTISLAAADFLDLAGVPLNDWTLVRELALGDQLTFRQEGTVKTLGAAWQGPLPEFRQLRWELP